jgi:hypothetical protein
LSLKPSLANGKYRKSKLWAKILPARGASQITATNPPIIVLATFVQRLHH